MPRTIEFEGRRIEVPDDATDAEIRQILATPPAGSGVVETYLATGVTS